MRQPLERVTVTVERSEDVHVELGMDGVWLARGVALSGRGDTPHEAVADYRRLLEAETARMVEAMQVLQRRGNVAVGCAL